ncbi:hypothetical protein Q2414_25730, partial [Escherichia coli]|nr:hypothetical protein [Escherichia coli]
ISFTPARGGALPRKRKLPFYLIIIRLISQSNEEKYPRLPEYFQAGELFPLSIFGGRITPAPF